LVGVLVVDRCVGAAWGLLVADPQIHLLLNEIPVPKWHDIGMDRAESGLEQNAPRQHLHQLNRSLQQAIYLDSPHTSATDHWGSENDQESINCLRL
jgi:hypothetical protein